MRVRVALLAAALLTASVSATAQQRPQPINPSDASSSSATGHHHNLTPLRFPATAARYEQYITFMLDTIRKLVGKGGVTQGDVNKFVLAVKDCASNAEADGVVTEWESRHCGEVMKANVPHPKPNH